MKMIEKVQSVIICVLTACSISSAWADVSYSYRLNEIDGGVVLTGVTGGTIDRELIIPSVYEGYTVTGIGDGLFAGNLKITSVTIPGTAKTIGKDAFDSCSNLKTLTLGEGVESIGSFAFGACSIETVSLPASLKYLSDSFAQNPKTKFVVAADNPRYYVSNDGKLLLDRIDRMAVSCLANPGDVSIPEGVVTLGSGLFEGVNWKKVAFPKSLEKIMSGAIHVPNSKITELDFSGTSLRRVGPAAFWGTSNVKKITLPATLSELCEFAFAGCSSLEEVRLLGAEPAIPDESDDEVAYRIAHLRSYGATIPSGDRLFMAAEFKQVSYIAYKLLYVAPLKFVTTYVNPDMGWENVCATGTWHGRPIKMMAGVDATYGPFVPGEKVSRSIPTLAGYTAKGLPSGLNLDKNTGEISGTPTKPTGDVGVSVTFTKKGAETLTAKFIVGPIPTVNVTFAGDTDKCKVSGANKAYLVGKKVSLSATAPKGTAFVGWFKDSEPWPNATESGKAKLSFVMTTESLSLVAKFEKEKMTLACPDLAAGAFTVGVAGSDDGIPLEISTQSGVKSVKATKLPTGMKLVKDKTTGEWMITGAPTKAGSFNVVLTVTAVSGATESITIPITVEALPSWAVGTFIGVARQVDYDGSGNVVRDGEGLHDWYDVELTVTVAANGKISGKAVFPGNGGSLNFKAAAYTGFAEGCYRVSGIEMSANGHKMVIDLMVTGRVIANAVSSGDMTVAAREVAQKTSGRLVTVATDDGCPLRQNVWKMNGKPLPPSVNGKVVTVERDDYVYTLTFGKNGAVSDSLALVSDPKKLLKKGKPIFSVVDYVDGVWWCELFGSVILDTPEGGDARIQCRVNIADDGNLTCDLVE